MAHFFRRAFDFLRTDGCFGLLATNTIGQGDTRASGLRWICTNGGIIYTARKRHQWPGQAAVIVSVVHVIKGNDFGPLSLDGRLAPIITAYLFHAGGHDNPIALKANEGKSYIGFFLRGMGFTFDDRDKSGTANSISLKNHLIAHNERASQRIFPYLGGEEINNHPKHCHYRYVIDFDNFPLQRQDVGASWAEADDRARIQWRRKGIVPLDYPAPVAADYPTLLDVIERKVKPDRLKLGNSAVDRAHKLNWWRFANDRPELRAAISNLERVLVISRVTHYAAFTFLSGGIVYSEQLVVIASQSYMVFCTLQSRIHEMWARFFASSMKDDLRYTPSDCFETFPFPLWTEENEALEVTGQEYYEFRATLMIQNNEGLTKTYNRFHNPEETSPDILRLRELHAAMDRAVLDAYGWTDIPTDCDFIPDYEDEDDDDNNSGRRRKKPWRYRWPDPVRDEVLARLLALNAQRAEEERIAGLRAQGKSKPATAKRIRKSET